MKAIAKNNIHQLFGILQAIYVCNDVRSELVELCVQLNKIASVYFNTSIGRP